MNTEFTQNSWLGKLGTESFGYSGICFVYVLYLSLLSSVILEVHQHAVVVESLRHITANFLPVAAGFFLVHILRLYWLVLCRIKLIC